MDPINPRFNSKSLQEAFDSASAPIDNYHLNLDAVSEDIKALEKYLEKSGVRHRVTETIFAEQGFSLCIAWAQASGSERWRILYEYKWREDLGTWEAPDWKYHAEIRPLIECPAQERLQTYPALAHLLKAVGESVALKERLTIPKA